MFEPKKLQNSKLLTLKTQFIPPDFLKTSVRNILIIRPGAIGDTIVTLPTIGAIRDYIAHAKIEIMGYPSFLEIVRGRFYADAISRFDQAEIASLFIKNAKIPSSLQKRFRDTDLIISLVSDKERTFSNKLKSTGAKYVVCYEPFPPEIEHIHIVDHFLRLLDILGIPHGKKIPNIFLHDEDVRFGEEFIKNRIVDPEKKLIAIHPGSGSHQKCWPTELFAELIQQLNKKIGAHILVVSGPADTEIIEELKVRVNGNFILVNLLPLPCLAAVLKRCNLFIGNDSGITHLAAAVGTPTIAIFGPTDPNVWKPRGEQVKILYNKIQCSPCPSDIRRDCLSQACLEKVHVEDVIHETKMHF